MKTKIDMCTAQIKHVNALLKDLPIAAQASVSYIGFYVDCSDAPGEFEQRTTASGTFNPASKHIALRAEPYNTPLWWLQVASHECAHGLYHSMLTPSEREKIKRFYNQYKSQVALNGYSYAAKNAGEFFAEAYSMMSLEQTKKGYTAPELFFRKMGDLHKYIQSKYLKYDLVNKTMSFYYDVKNNGKNVGIIFSYKDGETHVYGYSAIPKNISMEKAKKMVVEKKARFVSEKEAILYTKQEQTDMTDDEGNEGRWVTMRGTHVFIREGETPKEAILRKVSGLKGKDLKAEERIQEHMEKHGSTREAAERMVKEQMQQEEREDKVKKVDKRIEQEKKKVDEKELRQKQILLQERIGHLRRLNQGKSGAQTFSEILGLLADMVKTAQRGGNVLKPVQHYINKLHRDRTMNEKQKQKYIKQIEQLHKEIDEMTTQQDMINKDKIPINEELEYLDMMEYVELLEDAEFYDLMDFVECLELADTFDTKDKQGREGRWVTIKGTHVFIPEGMSVEKAMKQAFEKKERPKKKEKKEIKKAHKEAPERKYSKQEGISRITMPDWLVETADAYDVGYSDAKDIYHKTVNRLMPAAGATKEKVDEFISYQMTLHGVEELGDYSLDQIRELYEEWDKEMQLMYGADRESVPKWIQDEAGEYMDDLGMDIVDIYNKMKKAIKKRSSDATDKEIDSWIKDWVTEYGWDDDIDELGVWEEFELDRKDFTGDFSLDTCITYYTTEKGLDEKEAKYVCGAILGKIAGARKKKAEEEKKKIDKDWKKTGNIMDRQRAARKRYKQYKEGQKNTFWDTESWKMRADFSDLMHGPITRAGPFDYEGEILFKDWNNLKDVFSKIDHVPVIGSKGVDSHLDTDDRIIGFAHNFKLNEDTKQVLADVETFKEIEELSDLENPSDLPVSIGFKDEGEGKIQKITGIKHLAMSLNGLEQDRCSSAGGLSCTVSKKTGKTSDSYDFYTSTSDSSFNPDLGGASIKNYTKNDFIMPDKEEIEDREDAMEDGAGAAVKETSPEQLFMRRCIDGGHSQEYCSQAWKAKKDGGGVATKTGEGAKQDPTKHKSSDFMEISKDEYADLIAAAKTLNDSKDFLEKLKKREEKVVEEEKNTLTKFFLEDRKVTEDFIKDLRICDLKLLKSYDDLIKEQDDEFYDLQDFNNQRLIKELGKKQEDFSKLEEEYRKEALKRLGVE